MPTSWKRADDNALRAHLQEALSQRAATADAGDWSYSDYDVAAIRTELDERQQAHDALRDSETAARISSAPPGSECDSCVEQPTAADPDVARLRVLIARCFNPARHQPWLATADDADLQAVSLAARHRVDGKASTPVFARLQRLR